MQLFCLQALQVGRKWVGSQKRVSPIVSSPFITGVNLVLNSLAEEKLQASLRCLAQHGRFLEIGKFDLSNNSQLGKMGLQEISLPMFKQAGKHNLS